ncbi:MAG: AMP-binding protein, partial [Verrucomicrobiota bacterium]|nr:AMP-binding protein [Verrucomicrobiota bacterium]
MSCPLKEAARDAPNQLALLSKDHAWTFADLDRLVDELPILQMFSAWRKERSFQARNPRLPRQMPEISGPAKTVLLQTSGSTAEPKIAILSMQNLIANAESAVAALNLKAGDQWKLSLPLYHVGGIGILIRCILARATVVIDDSPHITHLSYVPTQLYRSTPIYPKLRCLLLGGAPIGSYPPHLPVHTTYGLTEMASMVTLDGSLL